MVISHNMTAMNANRQFNINTRDKAKSAERLSSGYRINRASDDAAGLNISERMRRQIRGLNQGTENIQDGVSVTQIMDGTLGEVQDILHRMTELSVQAANATLTPEDRNAIEAEMRQLRAEINRTTDTASFNGKPLLKAGEIAKKPVSSLTGKTDVVFIIDNTGSMGEYIQNVLSNLSTFSSGLSDCNVNYGVLEYGDISEGGMVSYPMTDSADSLKNMINNIKVNGGGDPNESALEGIMEAMKYPLRADATKEFILITDALYHDKNSDGLSSYSKDDIQQELEKNGIRLSVVTSPSYMNDYKNNLANGSVLNMESDFADSLEGLAKDIAQTAGGVFYKNPQDINIQMSSEINDYLTIHTYDISTARLGIENVSCLTEEEAGRTIDKVGSALEYVSRVRSAIGAEQNGLEHAYRLKQNEEENTQAAESRIRDTDMAKEMVRLSMKNILEQVGGSMVAQANQSNQDIMRLLQ